MVIRIQFKGGMSATINNGVWWSADPDFTESLVGEDVYWRSTTPVYFTDSDLQSAEHAAAVFDGKLDTSNHKPPKRDPYRVYQQLGGV